MAERRDILEADLVCVGAGVASLATAIRFLKKCHAHPDREQPVVLIIEKGKNPGSHVLSGSIIDTEPFSRLLSADELQAMPFESTVEKEHFFYLTPKSRIALPITPPPMKTRGLPMASLSKLTARLGSICEKLGGEIYAGLTGETLLEDDNGKVIGLRLGDKGIDKNGQHKPNYIPGSDIHAKMVVLGEGGCGTLTEKLLTQKGLRPANHGQAYALGIKEVIEVPRPSELKGEVIHTFGYPLDNQTYGGGFLYGLNDRQIAIGLVIGLDYKHTEMHLHNQFRAFKEHPAISRFLKGGKVIGYGAKILPEGGYFAVPELAAAGVMIVGDGGGLLDAVRLKGIHLAVESGMAAGDALYECWKTNDGSVRKDVLYKKRLHESRAWKELKQFKNVRARFQQGLYAGMGAIGCAWLSGGRIPAGHTKPIPDHERTDEAKKVSQSSSAPGSPGNPIDLDILTDIYYSGTEHEEDQPCHLLIKDPDLCSKQCKPRFDAPCTRFCPAQVYEWDQETESIRIQAENCIHCKTCQIKDPLQNIEWKLPEGGGGPNYKEM